MEGTKIFKSVYYMTESTRECQKAKKIGTEISILGAFSLFWAVNYVLRGLESRSRFFEPSLDLSRPAKNLSRHNTNIQALDGAGVTFFHTAIVNYSKYLGIPNIRRYILNDSFKKPNNAIFQYTKKIYYITKTTIHVTYELSCFPTFKGSPLLDLAMKSAW